MKIRPFGVEEWMNRWETLAANNIAETCVDSLTLYELLDFSGRKRKSIFCRSNSYDHRYLRIFMSIVGAIVETFRPVHL